MPIPPVSGMPTEPLELIPILPRSWVWGTPEERRHGGFPGIILWDSILPWSYPPGGHADNPWWRTVDETDATQTGQFQGYYRNMTDHETTGQRNFPDDRRFNTVFIRTVGLTNMPFDADNPDTRPAARPDNPEDTSTWPFAADESTGHDWSGTRPLFKEVLQTYFTSYLAPTTKFIVEFSLRDLIAWMEEDDDSLHDDAETAFKDLMSFILDPATVDGDDNPVGPRLLAWYLVHEPEQMQFVPKIHMPGDLARLAWPTPTYFKHNLVQLYGNMRVWEQEIRADLDPDYAALSDAEQKELLRPVATTFSGVVLGDNGPLHQHHQLADFAQTADIFFFDSDQWWRTWDEVRLTDYITGLSCTGFTDDPNSLSPPVNIHDPDFAVRNHWRRLLSNPVSAIHKFREVRRQIQLATGGGKECVFWSFNAGGPPFREDDDGPGPTWVPQQSASLPVDCGTWEVPPSNYKGYFRLWAHPSARRQRMHAWAVLEEGSQGMAFQNQFAITDANILAELVPIAEEFRYFANLRWSGVDHADELFVGPFEYGGIPDYHGVNVERDAPVVRWFNYEQPPEGVLDLPSTTRWLLVINRDDRRVTCNLGFQDGRFDNMALRELEFPNLELGAPWPIWSATLPKIDIDGWDMRIFMLVPWP